MSLLLALDTSTEACSVALLYHNDIIHFDETAQRSHTQRILPLIDQVLAEAGVSLSQLDALVVGRGPGSFTGVRVGTGIAQGLAFGADLPVIPVSNLSALAQAAYEQQQATHVLAAIDARMNEVYFAQMQLQADSTAHWHYVIAETVIKPADLLLKLDNAITQAYKVGTGWQAYAQLDELKAINTDIRLPSARYMLSLATPLWQAGQAISAEQLEPVYLRNQVTWQKLPGRA